MDAFMGAPTHPLLGAADNYSFPMTSSLLGSVSDSQPDWTQVALGLAGNPHAGPYANAHGFLSSGLPSAGSGSQSTGSQVAGGLLSALEKNPSLVKNGVNAAEGLLGGGLGAYGSGAAADSAVTGALGSVGSQTAGEAAAIQAANDAALGSGAAGGAAAGSGAGSGAAGGSLAGGAAGLGILAIPLIAGMATNSVSGLDFNSLLNDVKQGKSEGLTQNNPLLPNGSVNPDWVKFNNALTELQGGAYQSPWVQQALNNLGYQEYGQMLWGPIQNMGGHRGEIAPSRLRY